MGTTWSVRVRATHAGDEGLLRAAIGETLEAVEQEMSHYREDSTISRFNHRSGSAWFPVSEEFARLVMYADRVFRETGGAFDVTCAPLVDLWGFGPKSGDARIPTASDIAAAMNRTGSRHLDVRAFPPALRKDIAELELNLSAVAKGHAVDRVGRMLAERGIGDWLVEVGGELKIAGEKASGVPWTIAIERPLASGRLAHTALEVEDTAVATSGDYLIFWEHEGRRFSHIIDPRTGRPVRHDTASASVFASTCAEADAWATALLVLGAERGLELADTLGLAVSFVVRTTADQFDVKTSSAYRRRYGDR
jgi:thiamine biosynthesis lipoprotein